MESSERPCLPASSRSSRKNGRERSGSSARFSPTTSTPACASRLISSSPTYFVATTTVTSGPTSERIRSRLAPICSADVSNDSLAARDSAVATVREKEPRLARRAASVPLHGADAGGAQRALGRLREVEVAPPENVRAEALAVGSGHLLPHLVAARPDPGADGGGQRAAAEGRGP